MIKKTTEPITDHGCVSVYDSHLPVGGFHLISHDLAQVMELENIVANTVYLKARESEYHVGIYGKRIAKQRPKAPRDYGRLLLCVRARELSNRTQPCHLATLSSRVFDLVLVFCR